MLPLDPLDIPFPSHFGFNPEKISELCGSPSDALFAMLGASRLSFRSDSTSFGSSNVGEDRVCDIMNGLDEASDC